MLTRPDPTRGQAARQALGHKIKSVEQVVPRARQRR
jgi:hypothetical protein